MSDYARAGYYRVTFCDEPYESEGFATMEEAQAFAMERAKKLGRESDIEEIGEVRRVRLLRSVEVITHMSKPQRARTSHEVGGER